MQDVPVLVAPLTGEGDDVRIGIYCTHQAVDVTVGRVVAGDLRLGALGVCEEHSAHGYCCACGHFLLGPSTGVRRVEAEGLTHTAFRCSAAEGDDRG